MNWNWIKIHQKAYKKNNSALNMSFKKKLIFVPFLGRIILFLFRTKIAIKILFQKFIEIFKWLIFSKELTNYTYNLHPLNKAHLICFISLITGKKFSEIEGYIKEIEKDEELKKHIKHYTKKNKSKIAADLEPKYGRRIGWYAFVRALKPKIVVETGVDKGLGACILLAALKKNVEEGHQGYYYGTEIDLKKGYLLNGAYSEYGEILYGDSIKSLLKLDKKIDIFINDSDHSSEYEKKEYEIIKNKLNKDSIILGDNCLCTNELLKFSLKQKRKFLLFQERSKDHWYPGAAIGASFNRLK